MEMWVVIRGTISGHGWVDPLHMSYRCMRYGYHKPGMKSIHIQATDHPRCGSRSDRIYNTNKAIPREMQVVIQGNSGHPYIAIDFT